MRDLPFEARFVRGEKDVYKHIVQEAGIELCFAELKDPVKDKLRRFGLYQRFGDGGFFPSRFGSDELKQQFLVPAIAGECVSAIAVTEPGAGSDVAAIQTRAERSGDEWVINGSKIYITNAATADWLWLLAGADPGALHAPEGELGLAARGTAVDVHDAGLLVHPPVALEKRLFAETVVDETEDDR